MGIGVNESLRLQDKDDRESRFGHFIFVLKFIGNHEGTIKYKCHSSFLFDARTIIIVRYDIGRCLKSFGCFEDCLNRKDNASCYLFETMSLLSSTPCLVVVD